MGQRIKIRGISKGKVLYPNYVIRGISIYCPVGYLDFLSLLCYAYVMKTLKEWLKTGVRFLLAHEGFFYFLGYLILFIMFVIAVNDLMGFWSVRNGW